MVRRSGVVVVVSQEEELRYARLELAELAVQSSSSILQDDNTIKTHAHNESGEKQPTFKGIYRDHRVRARLENIFS